MFSPHDVSDFITIAIAAVCGGVLGLEREVADKPAGVRTHIFVCAGSALLMILSQEIVDQFQEGFPDAMLSPDPIRTLQAIVVGISFLGAGTIVRQKHEGVEGLTTAATIYLTAGIGVAIAVDRVGLGVALTLFATIVLVLLKWLTDSIAKFKTRRGKDA
ncbi:MgtC/SapB family protein [Allorhodopirellula heiligendammensis]|uniref:Mg(2+) transport ATPase n=1 Tax=Allorhodopirellula heiligendammensis TaxID=2714739 RepID=A0A5C6BYE2_9BACT|nr:MgtC/SapB family protein [Allorhodopirellula heiligendammensis]TWU16852.1 putative Mg(2+) transport ATPase [Allorhodopirellula heiligendammensis]